MNTKIKNKLVELEANLDAVLFRRNVEEEDYSGMIKTGIGAAGLGAGAFGAYKADQAIMRKYSMMPGVGRRDAYRQAGMDAMDTVKGYGASAKTAGQAGMAAGTKSYAANASKGGGMMRGLFGGIRKGLRVASGGRIRLSAQERLVELAYGRQDESRMGNAGMGALKGAAYAAAGGSAMGAAAGPALSRYSIDQIRDMRKTGRWFDERGTIRTGMRVGDVITKDSPTGRKMAAWGIRNHRAVAKGGVMGRGRAAVVAVPGYALTGAVLGGGVGLLRRPKKAE